eukprot:c40634_g1_i1.p1 GENE.c40634_g1_i1~~c40634_g1_i1.p1  ORF type:complete len:313 (-),score=53.99 c40634_g1_i1:80-1018(-)
MRVQQAWLDNSARVFGSTFLPLFIILHIYCLSNFVKDTRFCRRVPRPSLSLLDRTSLCIQGTLTLMYLLRIFFIIAGPYGTSTFFNVDLGVMGTALLTDLPFALMLGAYLVIVFLLAQLSWAAQLKSRIVFNGMASLARLRTWSFVSFAVQLSIQFVSDLLITTDPASALELFCAVMWVLIVFVMLVIETIVLYRFSKFQRRSMHLSHLLRTDSRMFFLQPAWFFFPLRVRAAFGVVIFGTWFSMAVAILSLRYVHSEASRAAVQITQYLARALELAIGGSLSYALATTTARSRQQIARPAKLSSMDDDCLI